MKQVIAFCFLLGLSGFAQGQLKTTSLCPALVVDVLDGKINDLEIISTLPQVKKSLPCFTSSEPEDSSSKCGGGAFYKDRDIYFFTGRDYVEIGPKFKGKLTVPLMGANRNGLFKWLGIPKIKDVNWDAFTTAYGIIILYYDKAGKVNRIQLSTKGVETIKLCD